MSRPSANLQMLSRRADASRLAPDRADRDRQGDARLSFRAVSPWRRLARAKPPATASAIRRRVSPPARSARSRIQVCSSSGAPTTPKTKRFPATSRSTRCAALKTFPRPYGRTRAPGASSSSIVPTSSTSRRQRASEVARGAAEAHDFPARRRRPERLLTTIRSRCAASKCNRPRQQDLRHAATQALCHRARSRHP